MNPEKEQEAKAGAPPRWLVHREKGGVPRAYDTETFGGHVRWVMIQKRLTRRSVAIAAGVDPSYLQRILVGARDVPRRGHVEAIIGALHVDGTTGARLRLLAGHYAVNPTLEAVRRVLDSEHLATETKAEFAVTVERIAAWCLGETKEES